MSPYITDEHMGLDLSNLLMTVDCPFFIYSNHDVSRVCFCGKRLQYKSDKGNDGPRFGVHQRRMPFRTIGNCLVFSSILDP